MISNSWNNPKWFNNSYLPCISFTIKPNQTKHHNWILFLLNQLHVSSWLLHYIIIHVFVSMTLPYFFYFIKHALVFCKVRSKLLGLTFKGKQDIFPHHQPLLSPAIALPHTYITKQLWCQLQFILNRNHWFAHWLSKNLWLLLKLSCHFCCPCWFTQFVCERQWMHACYVMHICWIVTYICAMLHYLMYSIYSKMQLLH